MDYKNIKLMNQLFFFLKSIISNENLIGINFYLILYYESYLGV